MEKKIEVPAGMWDAAQSAAANIPMHWNCGSVEKVSAALEAALRWLSENPIVPTPDVAYEMAKRSDCTSTPIFVQEFIAEWQRRMFLASEPDVSGIVQDLLLTEQSHSGIQGFKGELNLRILEAYRRGKASR